MQEVPRLHASWEQAGGCRNLVDREWRHPWLDRASAFQNGAASVTGGSFTILLGRSYQPE